MPFRVGALLLCGAVLGGCAATGQTQTSPDAGEFKRWLSERYVLPFARGDAAAWANAFAADAVGLHDRRPADVGRAAIAEFGHMVAKHLKVDRFDIDVEEVRVNGNWAFTRGSYQTRLLLRGNGSDSGLGGEGKFFILWERQPSGEWKIIVDMGNRKS